MNEKNTGEEVPASSNSEIEKSEKSIDAKKSEITTMQDQSKAELENITKEIDVIKLKLEDMKQRIRDAETVKNGTKEEIGSINQTLEKNINTIDGIHQSISSILDNLKDFKYASPNAIVNPIDTRINPLTQNKTYLDYTFSALLVLIVMFMSILLSSTIVMTEKESSAFFRNNIAPVKNIIFNISTYLTNLIVVFFQLMVLLIVAYFGFNVNILSVAPSIVISIMLVASIFVCLGMMIGYLFTTEETATLGAISVSCILLLFSSTLIPIESLAPSVARFAQYSPFVLGEALTRKMIVFGKGFSLNDIEVYLLLIELIVAGIFVSIATRINKRRIK